MPTNDVIDRVRALRSELANARPDAPHLQTKHEEVAKAVDTILLDPTKREHYTGLRGRLEAAYETFEGEHPQLASAIERVVRSLDAVGL